MLLLRSSLFTLWGVPVLTSLACVNHDTPTREGVVSIIVQVRKNCSEFLFFDDDKVLLYLSAHLRSDEAPWKVTEIIRIGILYLVYQFKSLL
jgi:hypothetical protein